MIRVCRPYQTCLLLLAVVHVTGCQQTEDPALAKQRAKYTLASEPSGAIGILEARSQIDQLGDDQPIVVVGKISTDTEQTWEPGKAAFVITDPVADHDEGDGHDHDNCPFCQAKADGGADPTALVQVVDDETGEVVNHDARRLFGLSAGQLIVVRGRASVDALGNLVLAADAIYPRR